MSNIAVYSRIQRMTSNIFNAFLNGAPRTPPHDLKVTAPATATAGQAFTFTVLAEDAAGSPVQPNGPIHFTSGDTSPGVHLPADSVLTNGQGTFSATLDRAGSQTITASDAAESLTSSVTVQVGPAPVGTLPVMSSTAQPATAGMPISFTATAQDQFANVDTSYAGTVHFDTSDQSPGVALPPDSTLTNGQQTFSATLDQAGLQTITGTDIAQSTIGGSVGVQIIAADAAN